MCLFEVLLLGTCLVHPGKRKLDILGLLITRAPPDDYRCRKVVLCKQIVYGMLLRSVVLLRVVVFAWKEERWENINYLARRAEQALKTFSAKGESGGLSKDLFSL